MKYPILPLFTVFFVMSSCAQEPNNYSNQEYQSSGYEQNQFQESNTTSQPASMDSQAAQNQGQEQASSSSIVWYKVKDTKTGLNSSKIPMPSSWKVRNPTQEDESTIVGPKGFKAYSYPGQSYFYTQDQFMAQAYSQGGMQLKSPLDVATLVEQELIAAVKQQGVSVVSKYHLPALAAHDRNYSSQLYGAQSSQSQFDAYVVEMKDKDGVLSMAIVRYYAQASMGMTFWGYSVCAMEADASYYEQAKKEYVNALVNTQYNPAHIAQHNANERAKAQQSQSQHNQRMASNQQAFDASQQAYRTRQQANDIQMQGWQNTQNMQDQGHSNYINSINETQVVTDPNNGQTYQVEAGANQTWMNGNGEYIQSNDYNYNPNTDNGVNNSNWEDTGGWDD